jgi:hypothetical protein
VPVPDSPPLSPALLAGLSAAALAQWGLVVWGWHAALGHAMRARGLARWTPGDTLLVSPLFGGGALVAIAALDLALVRLATGGGWGTPAAVAVAAAVVCAFGIRAVGKLY